MDIRTGSIGLTGKKVTKSNSILRLESLFFKNRLINTHSLAKELNIRNYDCLPIGAVNRIKSPKVFDKINLLYIGTLDKRRIEETLEGLKLFIDQNTFVDSLRYDIVGFGSREIVEKIKKKIEELQLRDIVFFHGRKTIEELSEFFYKANIGVAYIPIIKCYECQPALKTLEYLINGMPVIATKTFEMKQIVNEKNGILIDDTSEAFANGLTTLIKSIKNFNSEDIKKTVEKYSWENIIVNKLEPYLENCTS
ncbi:glycosyltransferase family 4 protein [Ancylomarina longa]|uniref:glycosyltransferase family 4 protein n=1 Tax=Ancylomarina longa TaxID=2487017 RepID=UPI001ADDEC80|nr:glycosyltransferase family 4 protein [Ancylomarina longa]